MDNSEYLCDRCGDDVGSDSLRQCECGMKLCMKCEWSDEHGIPCAKVPANADKK